MINLYETSKPSIWQGRVDDSSDLDSYRWHQLIQLLDLNRNIKPIEKKSFCFLGFKSDEGVRRNQGRQGAIHGPDSIRQQMANLPSYFGMDINLFDAGNIVCHNDLESAQKALSEAVLKILEVGMFPLLLGGGHEIALGHYIGLHKFFKQKKQQETPAIINIDAHFDMRPYPNGGSSGTMFHQIADFNHQNKEKFKYMVLGIQQSANTKSLFKRADNLGAKYILAKNISNELREKTKAKIDAFTQNQKVYLTLCSDVFNSAAAPGVSAPQPFGMNPETILQIIKHIAQTGKMISFDIAEVSPRFDDDHQTAKLASVIIFALINTLYNPKSNLILA